MEWHQILEQRSDKIIAEFIQTHPEYSVDPKQPDYRGGTNLITMGHRGEEPIAFKYLDNRDRYLNESFCLNHFASTELVPRIFDCMSEKLIVMQRLRSDGRGLDQLDAKGIETVSTEIGDALARLAEVPLVRPANGYWPISDFTPIPWGKSPRESIILYLKICRRIQATISEYNTPLFSGSLDLIEAHVDHIAAQREILYHEDISNFTICDGHFTGFFDLEMMRGGTEAMQLGVVAGLSHLSWARLLSGYETRAGRKLSASDLLSVLAMQHFYHWIRVCRWGWWNGDPEQRENRDTAVADCAYYATVMTVGCRTLQPCVDLRKWFATI